MILSAEKARTLAFTESTARVYWRALIRVRAHLTGEEGPGGRFTLKSNFDSFENEINFHFLKYWSFSPKTKTK